MSADVLDALELDLRRLAGVTFVTFRERGEALVVDVVAEAVEDGDELQARAQRVARGYVGGPLVVSVVGPPALEGPSRSRVRLMTSTSQLPGEEIEIHLSHFDRRVNVLVPADDRLVVASAVVSALRELAPPMPFDVSAAQPLPAELGPGSLVALEDPQSGEVRHGVAGGESVAESTARAVLNALNRYLDVPSHERSVD